MSASIHSFARTLPFPGERRASLVAIGHTQAERRLKFRYPLELSVRFRCCSRESRISGDGLVVNMSSGGVLVHSHHQIMQGAIVEVSIEWPSLLDGRIPLQLVATGRVLRSGLSHFAASFDKHEFRTLKRLPSPFDYRMRRY
jgi:PilZ domain-containing protein